MWSTKISTEVVNRKIRQKILKQKIAIFFGTSEKISHFLGLFFILFLLRTAIGSVFQKQKQTFFSRKFAKFLMKFRI